MAGAWHWEPGAPEVRTGCAHPVVDALHVGTEETADVVPSSAPPRYHMARPYGPGSSNRRRHLPRNGAHRAMAWLARTHCTWGSTDCGSVEGVR